MSEGFNNSILAAQGSLVRKQAQSPNFLTGVRGWRIAKDGTAEFNAVVIRNGSIISGTTFVYNGMPALGNLVYSLSATGGTDSFGNTYLSGEVWYNGAEAVQITTGPIHSITSPIINFLTGVTGEGTPLHIGNLPNGSGTSYQSIGIIESSTTTGDVTKVEIRLVSGIQDGSVHAGGGLVYWKDALTAADMADWDYTGFNAFGTMFGVLPGTGTPASPAAPEIWHAAVLGTGWAAIGGMQTVQYRLTADNMIEIVGTCQSTSTTPSAVVFTLDPTHSPVTDQRVLGAVERVSGTDVPHAVDVGTGGGVTLLNNVTISGRGIYFYIRVPKS